MYNNIWYNVGMEQKDTETLRRILRNSMRAYDKMKDEICELALKRKQLLLANQVNNDYWRLNDKIALLEYKAQKIWGISTKAAHEIEEREELYD